MKKLLCLFFLLPLAARADLLMEVTNVDACRSGDLVWITVEGQFFGYEWERRGAQLEVQLYRDSTRLATAKAGWISSYFQLDGWEPFRTTALVHRTCLLAANKIKLKWNGQLQQILELRGKEMHPVVSYQIKLVPTPTGLLIGSNYANRHLKVVRLEDGETWTPELCTVVDAAALNLTHGTAFSNWTRWCGEVLCEGEACASYQVVRRR